MSAKPSLSVKQFLELLKNDHEEALQQKYGIKMILDSCIEPLAFSDLPEGVTVFNDRTIYYDCDRGFYVHWVKTYSSDFPSDILFSLKNVQESEKSWRVVDVFVHPARFESLAVGLKVLHEESLQSGRTCRIRSNTKSDFHGWIRTEMDDKLWEYARSIGKANYHKEADFYKWKADSWILYGIRLDRRNPFNRKSDLLL